MGTVHNLDEYREHVILVDRDGGAHVVQLSHLEEIAKGKMSFYEIDGWETLVPVIVEEWIDFIRGAAG